MNHSPVLSSFCYNYANPAGVGTPYSCYGRRTARLYVQWQLVGRCFWNYTLYLPEQRTITGLSHPNILTRLPSALILSTNSVRLEYSSWGYCYGNFFFWNF